MLARTSASPQQVDEAVLINDGVNGSDQGNQWYAGAKWQIDF